MEILTSKSEQSCDYEANHVAVFIIGGKNMGDKRELKRLMDREIKKGSFPLQFERIAYHKDTYRLIQSEEKLEEVFNYLFRMGSFRCYEEVTVVNNIYMDYDIIHNECIMRRVKSILERIELRSKMLFRARRLKPDYENGKVIAESIKCYFKVDQEQMDQYKMKRKEIEVYGFPMSSKYMVGLYLLCEEARRNVSEEMITQAGMEERYKNVARLTNVRDGIFKSLLLDNIHYDEGCFVADMISILIIE